VNEGPTTRPGYAQAIEDTKVAFIEKGAFLAFCREHPSITARLYQKALEDRDLAKEARPIGLGLRR